MWKQHNNNIVELLLLYLLANIAIFSPVYKRTLYSNVTGKLIVRDYLEKNI